ncbi:MAG: hypothetical protein H6807_12430 [Planctomycetes bacterium]|nr:hypothetical protein [Planctomycetota bacterium]
MNTRNGSKVLLVLLGLVLGVAFSRLAPIGNAAAATAGAVKLGHDSAYVVQNAGHPQRIAYGPDHQIWYYTDAQGETRARYWLNEGVVVRIEGD